MSLTDKVIDQIRIVVREETRLIVDNSLKAINKRLMAIEDRLEALENDVKEIYEMLSEKYNDKDFGKLPTEEKILDLHKKLVFTAKKAGVELPS